MAVWTDTAQTKTVCPSNERPLTKGQALPDLPAASQREDCRLQPQDSRLKTPPPEPPSPPQSTVAPGPPLRQGDHGWPIPSLLSPNPDQARACIQLPEFDDFMLEKARVISGRFPFAE